MGHKDMGITYLLWFFFGVFGIHRFYLERPVSGVIYLLTFGVFGIGWLIDVCLIPAMVEHYNTHHAHHHHTEVIYTQPSYTVVQPTYAPQTAYTVAAQPTYSAQPVTYQANPYPPPQNPYV